MMPGTSPNVYTQIVETAASVGYHAVGVQWEDRPCVACICAARCDDFNRTQKIVDCNRNAEKMRMFGELIAPPNDVKYRVDQYNSVLGRLVALLSYLGATPTPTPTPTSTTTLDVDKPGTSGAGAMEGASEARAGGARGGGGGGGGAPVGGKSWLQYLAGGTAHASSTNISIATLMWKRVSVGGHSRGSDYPVMLSKMLPIKRGLMFGGPGTHCTLYTVSTRYMNKCHLTSALTRVVIFVCPPLSTPLRFPSPSSSSSSSSSPPLTCILTLKRRTGLPIIPMLNKGQEFLGVCSAAPASATNCNRAQGFGEAAWLSESVMRRFLQ